jgi:hypothetical protein
MREGEEYPYNIIPKNIKTMVEKVPIARVKGITEALAAVRYHNSLLSQAEKDEGWLHYKCRSTGPFFNRILVRRGNDKPEGRGKR